jgi:cyclopropane fatty-acyl-phospholipid synthase-like methyltransferase
MLEITKRLIYSLWYFFDPPWDTGVTPPEVVETVEGSHSLPPGRAIDLGCGTGTNSLYLARHDWQVVGTDIAATAIRQARRKAKQAGLSAKFYVADVTRLDFLEPPFDLALDIGCFHSISATARPRYRDQLSRLLRSGACYMLYAFEPRQGFLMDMGLTCDQLQALFQPYFRLLRVERGADPNGPSSAWYWLERM